MLEFMLARSDTAAKSTGPGPAKLVEGDTLNGFYGKVNSGDLIASADLFNLCKLSAGRVHPSADNLGWAKVSIDNTILYVALTPMRYELGWVDLNAANLISGNTTVNILGYKFKVRLLKGLNLQATTIPETDAHLSSLDTSEWNRIMYRLCGSSPLTTSRWLNYTNSDLITDTGYGSRTICAEMINNMTAFRGNTNITSVHGFASTNKGTNFGWRPVLELIQ